VQSNPSAIDCKWPARSRSTVSVFGDDRLLLWVIDQTQRAPLAPRLKVELINTSSMDGLQEDFGGFHISLCVSWENMMNANTLGRGGFKKFYLYNLKSEIGLKGLFHTTDLS